MLHRIVFLAFAAQAALLVSAGVAHPLSLRQSVSFVERQDALNLDTSADCSEPKVRKEWRNLEPALQQEYISAVKCLFTKPSIINGNPGATLYDDFTTLHLKIASSIHFTAVFLPWHRYYVHLYESALHDCGYTGTQPYWNWSLDAGQHVDQSPIFDPVTGFGGTGTNASEVSPVANGPFNNITVFAYSDGLGSVSYNQPHKLARFLSSFVFNAEAATTDLVPAFVDASMNSDRYSPEMVEKIVAAGTTYDSFRRPFEGIPHAGIHSAVGGDMGPSNSPNDPIFFVHHCNVDRVWWHWQQRNPSIATDYSGNTNATSDVMDATVDDVMEYMGLTGAHNLAVKEVLLTNTATLCYKYED